MVDEAQAPGAGHPPVDLDDLPLPALVLDADGHARQSNAAFCRLTGLAAEQLFDTGWQAALPPDSRPRLHAALVSRADFSIELRLLRHDGSKGWLILHATWRAAGATYLGVLTDVSAMQLAVQAARAEVERFRMLADNVPALIAYYERSDYTCVYANRAYAETFGHDPRAVVGKTFAQVIGEEATAQIQPKVDIVLTQRRTVSYMRELRRPDEPPRWIEVNLIPHQLGDGLVVGVFVLIADITRHRQAEQDARESEERLAKFMDATVEGIAFHQDGYITDVNAPMAALLGQTQASMRGRFVLDFVAPEFIARVRQGMAELSEQPYEAALVDAQGRAIPVELIVRRTLRHGQELRLVVVRDIRDRQAARERIRQLALHDPLTGLRNRASFTESLEAALDGHRQSRQVLALLFIDLDHFKRINDGFGHLAGDAVLRSVATRMSALLPAGGAAGRFGGDEMVILVPGVGHEDQVIDLAHRLRRAVAAPIEYQGQLLSVTPSIGVSFFPAHGQDADALLRHADAALYAGKQRGRDAVIVYTEGMGAAVKGELKLEAQVERALSRGEFELLWQPRISSLDGRLVALQALVRWRHPQRGWLAPAEFVGAAGHRQLLQPLAAWALRLGLNRRRAWVASGCAHVPLSLDLGSMHPHGDALATTVARVLAEQPSNPGALWIELDEAAFGPTTERLPRWLERLRALGAEVLIDDFGRQGIPLTRLSHWPLAGVKVDPALIGDLPGDGRAAATVDAIIRLAHGLGLSVCASGVATGEQQRWLAEAGCDHLQGAWVEVPMTASELTDWLGARSS